MNRMIRAHIHESAVKRVTRIYAATLSEIFVETLQNSRRAGASRVRIAVAAPAGLPAGIDAETGDTLLTVTIVDDGAGIADPAVLLSFGENGWDDGAGPARGRRRVRLRQLGALKLHRLFQAAFHRRGDGARLARRARARSTSSARRAPKSTPTSKPRFRTGRRFPSGRPSPPTPSAARPRPPPGTTRCR